MYKKIEFICLNVYFSINFNYILSYGRFYVTYVLLELFCCKLLCPYSNLVYFWSLFFATSSIFLKEIQLYDLSLLFMAIMKISDFVWFR